MPGYNAKAVVSPLATDKGISGMVATAVDIVDDPYDAARTVGRRSHHSGFRARGLSWSLETVFLSVGYITRHLTATSLRYGPTTLLRYAPIS